MGMMCVLSTSLYNAKDCDDCGECLRRHDDDWDELSWEADREEAADREYGDDY